MRFDLKEADGYLPDLIYGEQGNELSCFLPDDVKWEQVNYGQGEGQVMIDSCEWGFYYVDDDTISIVLHSGNMPLSDASKFIKNVCKKVFGDKDNSVTISVTGTGDD